MASSLLRSAGRALRRSNPQVSSRLSPISDFAGCPSPSKMKIVKTLAKALTGKSVSAGRNSSGRITLFHQGGGHKRSLREIDFKRDTSSVGIVERIEYDPNRSFRIALV